MCSYTYLSTVIYVYMGSEFFSSEKIEESWRTENIIGISGFKIENVAYTMNLWKKLKDLSHKQFQIIMIVW